MMVAIRCTEDISALVELFHKYMTHACGVRKLACALVRRSLLRPVQASSLQGRFCETQLAGVSHKRGL